MSKFYGTVVGSARTEATRRGFDNIRVSAQSWDGSLITRMRYDADGRLIVQLDRSNESSSCFGRTIFCGTLEELEARLSQAAPTPATRRPLSRDTLIRAMAAAGYTYDELNSGDEYQCFNYDGGVMHMYGWDHCEDWLNGVVFDDLDVADRVYCIMNEER